MADVIRSATYDATRQVEDKSFGETIRMTDRSQALPELRGF